MAQQLRSCAPHAVVLCALAALYSAPALAQGNGGPSAPRADVFATPAATVARDGTGRVTVRATRVTEPITLDGALDEGPYARIQPIDGFLQQEPHEGQPATQKTDVWLFYDDKNVYVAARCWSTDPSRIVANEMRRDSFALFQNDNFAVLFDTFHDRRNGVQFQSNALGGMSDSLITDERDSNRDWNTVWDARARRFEQGWTVEFVIPFRSLRYPAPGPQDWGVQFRRVARGQNEVSDLTPMPAASTQRAMVHVSQAAALVGLEAAESRAQPRAEALRAGRGGDRLRGPCAVRQQPERAGGHRRRSTRSRTASSRTSRSTPTSRRSKKTNSR